MPPSVPRHYTKVVEVMNVSLFHVITKQASKREHTFTELFLKDTVDALAVWPAWLFNVPY